MTDARPFELATPDGEPLRGEVHLPDGAEPPSAAVVILHGFKGFRRWGFFPHVARTLAEAGYAAIVFDFSRNGVGPGGEDFDELESFARNTFSRERDEALQVLAAARAGQLPLDPPRRLGLLGHSRGGGVAVLAAAEAAEGAPVGAVIDAGAQDSGGDVPARAPIDALVTWSAVATFDRWDESLKNEWRRAGRTHVYNGRTGQDMPLDLTLLEDFEANRERLDIEAAASRLEAPWLIVHGSADTSVEPDDARRLARAAPAARLEIIEDAGHTFGASHPFEGEGPLLRAALEPTLRHFREALGAGGSA